MNNKEVAMGRIKYKNSGYNDFSKSWNAIHAEERGLRSISNIDRQFVWKIEDLTGKKITIKAVKDICKLIQPAEWHHTGLYAKKTDYYSPEDVAKYINNNIK